MKKIAKKAVSAILATVLLMSSVITGFAGTSGSAEGSNNGGVVTSSGGDFGVNYPNGRIGIRLSLVERSNPENVISVLPDGKTPMVVDCLYVTKDTFDKYTDGAGARLTPLSSDNEYSAVKTQNYTSNNLIYRIYRDEIEEILKRQGFSDDIATPVPWTKYEGNAYHSKGEEFIKWIWTNQDGNVVQSNGGALATSYTTSSGTVVSVKPADPAGKMLVGEVGDTKFKAVNSSAYYSYSMLSSKLNQKGVDMLIGPVFPSLEEGYAYQKCLIGWMKEAGRITDEEGAKLVNQLTDIYNNAKSSTTSSSNKKSTFFGKLKEKFIPSSMTSYADEATSNAGGGTGTSDTGGKQVSSTAIINALLTANATNGTPFLQTPSMVASGNTDILTATEDWCLLVEPLVYLTIFESGNDRHVVLRKQYGTISNIAEAMAAKAGGKYSSSAKYGFFNWKALNGPLWGALTVSKTKDKEGNEVNGFKFGDGSILTIPTGVGNYTSFNTLAGWNRWDTKPDGHREKVGYAVNVFWRDDLTDKSEIDTWDREKYKSGYPGPAPDASDDTKYPKETEFKEQSKKFQITKWYYIEEADGTQYVLDVKTRKDTPHIVNVINEGDVNSDYFWEVEKWGTSLTTDAPADGDTSTTFEEYWKKNPGTQSGKTPAQVTIKPTDPDKSIYAKLVLKVIMGNKIDIVRVYENKDGSTTVEPELDAKVKDTVDGSSPKPGYEFKESKTTPDPIKDITSSDGLWVKFRTYQTAVDDNDKVKLEATSDMKVLSDAKNKSTTFKDQVKRVLDNYEVVLLGSKGFTDENTIKGEWNQITGSAKKSKPFGADLASDDKYKLEAGNNNGKANASDLDILKEVDIETIWKLTSDADGNVRVYKNNSEVSSINKTQGVNQLIGGNTELSTLDDRTKVITNFINSLDRNLGSDRSGRTWYNEGFESVLVYERDFAFLLGFGNNAPVRSAALNIKLNGQMNSRHEMFTGENLENTARSFQFRTSKKSVLSEASGKPDGWVGDFEGLTVVIPQVDNLLTSKLFYTSNTTVMDLN